MAQTEQLTDDELERLLGIRINTPDEAERDRLENLRQQRFAAFQRAAALDLPAEHIKAEAFMAEITNHILFGDRIEPNGLRDDIEEHAASRLIVRGMTAAGFEFVVNSAGWTPGMRTAFAYGMEWERELRALDDRNRPVEF